MKTKDVLKDIISKKQEKILLAKQALPIEELKNRAFGIVATRPFIEAINKPRTISLIAEIKKSSPSSGIIRGDFNYQQIALDYQEAGVQAVSVLTEEDFFSGSISYINEIKNLINVPILRKDFIMDPYQIYESRVFGADAVLLIANLLSKDKLSELIQIASELGLDCLVEVHDEKELKKVLNLKAPLIGINHRDLHTLEVDLKTSERLFPLIPRDRIVVVESGIRTRQDVLFFKILGISSVLIGEVFMEALDIKKKVEEIMGW